MAPSSRSMRFHMACGASGDELHQLRCEERIPARTPNASTRPTLIRSILHQVPPRCKNREPFVSSVRVAAAPMSPRPTKTMAVGTAAGWSIPAI
jgi:hypothetical protein